MITTLECITPEQAAEYLENKAPNRTIRRRDVNKLARDIMRGEWKLTHQGIAFDTEGRLIDGQHRLSACVLANMPIKVLVTRGVTADDGMMIDRGIKRTFLDGLNISGEYNNKPWFKSTSIASAIRLLVRNQYNAGMIMSDSEMIAFITAFEDEVEAVYHICATGEKMVGAVIAAILAARIKGESVKGLKAFASVFRRNDLTAAEDYNAMPALNLSKQLLAAKAQHIFMSKEKTFNLAMNAVWLFLHSTNVKTVKETKIPRYNVRDNIINWNDGGKDNGN